MHSQADDIPNGFVVPQADMSLPTNRGSVAAASPRAAQQQPSEEQRDRKTDTDVLGDARVTLPKDWPIARPGYASPQERIMRSELRRAYAWHIQRQQKANALPVLPPCTWCGQPTGMFCDYCTVRPARAVCSECCDRRSEDICRMCDPL